MGSPRYGLAFIEIDSGDRSIDSAELQHVLSMLVLTYLDSSNCINIRPSFGGGLVATMHLPAVIIDIINTNIDYVRRTARLRTHTLNSIPRSTRRSHSTSIIVTAWIGRGPPWSRTLLGRSRGSCIPILVVTT